MKGDEVTTESNVPKGLQPAEEFLARINEYPFDDVKAECIRARDRAVALAAIAYALEKTVAGVIPEGCHPDAEDDALIDAHVTDFADALGRGDA